MPFILGREVLDPDGQFQAMAQRLDLIGHTSRINSPQVFDQLEKLAIEGSAFDFIEQNSDPQFPADLGDGFAAIFQQSDGSCFVVTCMRLSFNDDSYEVVQVSDPFSSIHTAKRHLANGFSADRTSIGSGNTIRKISGFDNREFWKQLFGGGEE